MLIKLGNNRHQLVDTELARVLRRELRDPFIETHFHKQHGSLVIGRFISRDSGIIEEIDVIEDPNDHAAIADAVARLKHKESDRAHETLMEIKRAAIQSDRDSITENQESADQHVEYREWLRTRKTRIHKQDHPLWVAV